MTRFIAFYPSRPFWVGGKPPTAGLNASSTEAERKQFTEAMSEEVYPHERDGFTLKVCRDGMIMLRVTRVESEPTDPNHPSLEASQARWGEYLDYLNAFYLLLDSATIRLANLSYFNLDEVTTRDAFAISFKDGKHSSSGIPSESIGSTFFMARYPSTYMAGIPVEYDPRISMRRDISPEVVAHAAQQFEQGFALPGLVKSLASFAKSLSEYKVGNYETSIVLAWFISESILNRLWTDHLASLNREFEGGEKRINTERQKLLTGRDFTASVISNLLELSGLLPYPLFKDLTAVRKHRNDIAHGNDYTPKGEHARLALETARAMIGKLWSLQFTPNMQFTLTLI